MNESAARMSVCVKSPSAWVKIVGRADYHFSEALKKLVHGLRQRDCSRFLLEFTDCNFMDSTFAGTLSRLGREFAQARNDNPAPSLSLVNANQRVADTLDNLGVIHLFQLLKEGAPDDAEFQPVETGAGKPDRTQLNRVILDAHCELVDINPANFEKFKDVLQYLEEDLKKMEGESKTSGQKSGA
jgi:anti-anti-sigma regulatory factor